MVKLSAFFLGAFLACNVSADIIAAPACTTPTVTIPPISTGAYCAPATNNNVVYGASNNLVGNLNTLVGS